MGLYAPSDYVVYILILLVIFVILRKAFERVRLDAKLIVAVSPFIFAGTFIRLLADTGAVEWNQFWSVTPWVYIVAVTLASLSLLAGFYMQKKTGLDYAYVPFITGLGITLYLLCLLSAYLIEPVRIIYPISFALFLTLGIYAFSVLFRISIFQKKENLSIFFAHLLDASSTFIAFNYYDFYEEHLLPSYLISLAGNNALIMIPIKIILIASTLYFVERWYSGEEKTEKVRTLYVMIKFLIFIIGIGPGIRNTMLPALKL